MAAKERTKWELARRAALDKARVTQADIRRECAARGVQVSDGTVWSLIAGRFGGRSQWLNTKSEMVVDVFCDLTGTEPGNMWPERERRARAAA